MNGKKLFFALFGIILIAASCKKENREETDSVIFTAWIEQLTVTKTTTAGQTGDVIPVKWSPADEIRVCCGSEDAVFKTSEDKISSAGIKTVFTGSLKPSASFAAIYPATSFKSYNASEKILSFIADSEQTWAAEGIADGALPAVACGADELVFKNVFGVLRFNVLGNGELARVKLTSKDKSVCLWGDFSLKADFGTGTPVLNAAAGSADHNIITLKCDTSLSPDKATSFNFILPPVILQQGFTLRFFDKNDKEIYSFSSVKKPQIRRGEVTEFPLINLDAGKLSRLFDILDLDYPGMEDVKTQVIAGDESKAEDALLAYFRKRMSENSIKNIDVNLANRTTYDNRNIADQAVQNRFYTIAYYESGSGSTTVYYSLDDGKGGISWDYINPAISDKTEYNKQIHRLLWMPYLAQAGYIDDKYVKTVVEQYSDYITKYPCPAVGNTGTTTAYTGLQLSERLAGWKNVLPYIIQSNHVTAKWLAEMIVYFNDLMECMRNTWYTPASNIHLEQVMAETEFSIFFPEYISSETWKADGMKQMEEEVQAQFNGDGVGTDLDPGYHLGVVDNFRHVKLFADANNLGGSLPRKYTEGLRYACEFMRDIVYPDCYCENYNETKYSRMTPSVLRRNFLNYAEMFPDDGTFEWMGTNGASGAKPTGYVQLYPISGFYMMRSGWDKTATMLVYSNNSNPRNMAHCQPDNGTVSLWKNGRRFLPDAGSYSYAGTHWDNSDRAAYAATKMHNTITLNGATIPKNYMNGEFIDHRSTADYEVIVARNNSYPNMTHLRAVFMVDKKFFVLVDEAGGSASGTVNLNMNLCSDPGGSLGTNACVIDEDLGVGKYGAHTVFTDGNNMVFRTFSESTNGFAASKNTCYYSDAIGERTQRRRYQVDVTKNANSTVRFITVMCPFSNVSELSTLGISASFDDASSPSLTVMAGGKTYKLSYTR